MLSKTRKRGMRAVELKELEEVGKTLGLFAGIIASATLIWKFLVSPAKKWYERNKARDAAVVDLTAACKDLKDSVVSLDARVSVLQTELEAERERSLKIRTNLYHGQVATISALRELATHSGLKINGPVQLYYEQNIDALRNELCKTE